MRQTHQSPVSGSSARMEHHREPLGEGREHVPVLFPPVSPLQLAQRLEGRGSWKCRSLWTEDRTGRWDGYKTDRKLIGDLR
jgi:hypothetical protein